MSLHTRFIPCLMATLAIGATGCSKKAPPPTIVEDAATTADAATGDGATTADAATTDDGATTTDATTTDDTAAVAPDAAPDAVAASADGAATPDATSPGDAAAATPDAAAATPDASSPGDAAAAADVAATGDASAAATTPLWSAEGFAAPESVLVEGDVYYVSNINGTPIDKDDNGFISKLGADGKVIELKWIDGAKADVELNAPKGMGIQGGVLYVADIDQVRKFDAKSGAPQGSIAIADAVFLNDIAVSNDGKTVYVSDSAIGADFKPKGTPRIFALGGEAAPTPLDIKDLGNVNGVFVESGAGGDVLYFNGFDAAKTITRFDVSAKTATTVPVPVGGLDGLAVVKDGEAIWYLVTSWEDNSVHKLDKDGKATLIASGLKGPADLAVDAAKKVVLVPVMMENRVAAFAL